MYHPRLPIVFVHGFLDKSSVFRRMASHLKHKGWEVYDSLDLIPNNGTISIEAMAGQLDVYINKNLGTDAPFYLVGFSMGGLVSRYYIQRMGGIEKVKHLVTISSPHFGTLLARVFNREACKQMRSNSIFLKELNRDLTMLKKIKCTSIWARFDTTILPNNSSHLPFGNETVFNFGIHPLMPYSGKVILAVENALHS